MIKRGFYNIFFLLLSNSLFAQVDFNEFPENMQLYARDNKDQAKVEISGTVKNQSYNMAELKLFIDNTYNRSFTLNTLNTQPSFKFEVPILAQLSEYRFEFWLKNDTDSLLIKSANNVLCGDAYILYGQSNAVSYPYYWVLNDSISKEYSRNYVHYYYDAHNDDGWHDATFPEVGTLGKWFIKNVNEKQKIPILLINGAKGGMSLKQLMKRNPNSLTELNNPYGLMLKRVYDSKIDAIKGFIFLQGEAEAHGTTAIVDEYPMLFDTFKKNLEKDLPNLKRFYVFQLGVMSTNLLWDAGKLREYKRQFIEKYDNVTVIPATGIPAWDFDGLHYNLNGYKLLADWLFQGVLASDEHKQEYDTPNLQKLVNEKTNKRLKLVFNQPVHVPEIWRLSYVTNYMKDYFYAGYNSGFIDSVKSDGYNMYLYYNNFPFNTLTYLPGFFSDSGNRPYGGPFIRNSLGTPALTFHDVPIQDELPTPELISSNLSATAITFNFNSNVANDCLDCSLEISQSTPEGIKFLKYIPSNQTEFTLENIVNNNSYNPLLFKYVNALSESQRYVYLDQNLTDTDNDGIPDRWDNCSFASNFSQIDFDNDGTGNACDTDADGDLIPDSEDDCLFQVNPLKPKLILSNYFNISSSVNADKYHWIINNEYFETTTENLYLAQNNITFSVLLEDNNGCRSQLSDPLSVVINNSYEASKSFIYPTPAYKNLNYVLSEKAAKAILYNLQGKQLKVYSISSQSGSLSLAKIKTGIYTLSFFDQNGALLYSQKVLKVE